VVRALRFLGVCVVLGVALHAQTVGSRVSEKTARGLVRRAIMALGARIPEANLMPLTTYWSPDFYSYQAYLPQPDDKPVLTFYFAVNPWNGEVWDAKNCKRITSPSLEEEQKTIWKRSALPEEARVPLHSRMPAECIAIVGWGH